MEQLNRKILERLKPARKVGADATGMRQSKRDCAWSSTSLNGRREYTKIHGLFNLETGTVEAFEATKGTAHECSHLKSLLSRLENIECLVADPGHLSRRNTLMKAKGCWPWKDMIILFWRRQRIEAGWHSLKSLVGDLIRNRTVQTIKTEI